MKVHIKVHANSSQEKVQRLAHTRFEIWLREKPADGKANDKLLKLMREYFDGRNVKLISGFTGKKKVLEVIGD